MSTIEAGQILDKAAPAAPTQNQGQAPTDGGKPADEKVSPKLEILIRREQQAVARERQAKQIEADLQARLRTLEEREARVREFESAKGNSKKALELLGLNYDELTKAQLLDGEIPPEVQIKKIEEKFEAFKSEKEKEEQRRQEQEALKQREAEARAISDFKSQINTYLSDNAARYEFIAFEGAQELVFDVIDEHYNRTLNQETGIGKVMSLEEAADKVEEYLEGKYNKAKELSKTKALWGSIPKVPLQEAAKQQTNIKPQQKTLTNQLSAKVQTPTVNRMLTDEERVQKAIAYAKGLRPQVG